MNQPDGGYRRILSRLAAPQTPPPWTFGEIITLFLAMLLAIIMIGTVAAMMMFGGTASPVTLLFGWTLGLVIMTAFVLFTRRGTTQMPHLKLTGASLLPLPYVIMLGVAAALIIDLIVAGAGGFHVTPALTCMSGDFSSGSTLIGWLLGGLFIIVVQPVAEGLVFSGVVLPRLRASLGAIPGIVATAILFTVLHAMVYGATLSGSTLVWYGVIMPLLTGLFLSCVRVYTDSTRAAILAQAGMGIILILAALILVTSGDSAQAGCQFFTALPTA